MPWGTSFLGSLTFHCLCLKDSSPQSLLSEFTSLRPCCPQRHSLSPSHLYSGSPFLFVAPHSAFFSFTALPPATWLFLCLLSLTEWSVHKARVLALLTEGTLSLEECVFHVYLPNMCPLQGGVDLVTDVLSNVVTVHAGKVGGMEERGASSPDKLT